MRRCRPWLGTFVEIDADSPEAIEAGFAAIARVHRLMSAHDPGSDVCAINRSAHLGRVEVDALTAEVIERARYWSERSRGAFDVVRAGKAALERGLLPRHDAQPEPSASHWSAVELDGAAVVLNEPGCIDLGGIAKGFAVDRAVAAMRSAGARRGLVNAGGDMFGFGNDPWRGIVVDPGRRLPAVELAIRNDAIATSALVNGCANHLQGGGRWQSVTVRAATACDADALTKIVWAVSDGLRELLAEAGASAFGIGVAGQVEAISREAVAA